MDVTILHHTILRCQALDLFHNNKLLTAIQITPCPGNSSIAVNTIMQAVLRRCCIALWARLAYISELTHMSGHALYEEHV